MARFLRVLLVAAIATPLVAAMPGRAVACECALLDPQQIVKQADAIVAGHVVSQTSVDPMHTQSVFAVDGVYRGRVASTLILTAAAGTGGGSDCAVLYPVGATVDPLVLSRRGSAYAVDPCALASGPQILALLGAARPPAEAAAVTSPAEPAPIAVAPKPGGVSWPAVAGGLVVAVALIGLALRRSARQGALEAASSDGVAAGVHPSDGEAPEPTAPEPSD
jgi:hypothetical protein